MTKRDFVLISLFIVLSIISFLFFVVSQSNFYAFMFDSVHNLNYYQINELFELFDSIILVQLLISLFISVVGICSLLFKKRV